MGPTPALAIPLIDTGVPAGPFLAGSPITNTQFFAQQFTLPTPATITEIAVLLGRLGTGPDPLVTVQLTNAIGLGTPPTALLAGHSRTVSNPFPAPAFLPVATSVSVGPGTYFVVLSSAADLADSAVWVRFAPVEIGPDFTAGLSQVNPAFPPGSNFLLPVGDNDYGLRISGEPVPEPSPLLVLGTGLAGLARLTCRRCRRKPSRGRVGAPPQRPVRTVPSGPGSGTKANE